MYLDAAVSPFVNTASTPLNPDCRCDNCVSKRSGRVELEVTRDGAQLLQLLHQIGRSGFTDVFDKWRRNTQMSAAFKVMRLCLVTTCMHQ